MSKTERPTANRLRRAFDEGDVPFSALVVRTVALVGAVAMVPSLARAVASRFGERLHAALEGNAAGTAEVLSDVVVLSAPVLAVAVAVAVGAGLVQTRGVLALGRSGGATERARKRRMPLLDGLSAARALVGALVVVALAAAVLSGLRRSAPDLAHTLGSASRTLTLFEPLAWRIAVPGFLVLAVACAVDYAIEHASWQARLRMTPAEIKAEQREREGDPEVRRARRKVHRELSGESATRPRE